MNTNTNVTTENTYDVFLALLRSALWGEERFPFPMDQDTPLDWDEICKELAWHAIHILPTDLLCRVDSAHQPRYLMLASRSVSHWYAIMEGQKALCEQLRAAEIPFVILKGAASACYYPQPTYRQMGDIDFLVPPEHFERARLLMLEENYKPLDEDDFRHIEFQKNRVLFELHRAFAIFNDPERAKLLDDLLFAAFKRLETATLEGYSFPMFPPLENGLVLLGHINQHLEEGLGLRQILDWALYVDKALDDDAWEHTFAPIVRRLGLERLTITVTRMCQLYLGLRPDITWCASADEKVCDSLMNYIMEQGNFGRKCDTGSHKTVKILSVLQNIPNFFRHIQYWGMYHWPALKKYPRLKPLLTPFAWFWQLCRYLHLGLKREQPLKGLMQDVKKTRSKDALMEELGVKQRKKGTATRDGMMY